MSVSQSSDLVDVLGYFNTLLQRGNLTYFQYMAEGKTFLYAEILRDNNMLMRELLLEHCHRLPAELRDMALEVINHIDVWNLQFLAMTKLKAFNLNDPFIFEGKYKYPTDAVNAIMAYHAELASDSAS